MTSSCDRTAPWAVINLRQTRDTNCDMKTQWEYDLVEKPFCEKIKEMVRDDNLFLQKGMAMTVFFCLPFSFRCFPSAAFCLSRLFG